LRLCVVYLSISLVASIYFVEALAILIAQGACLIQALASCTLTIVLEAYKPVGRRKMIAPSRSVYTRSFDTQGTASSSSFVDWGVNALDGAILKLSTLRVNAYRVVLLTGKDVVVALVVYPRDVIWVGIIQVVACVRVSRYSRYGGVHKSEGSDDDLHVVVLILLK